jgi:cyclopropane fatty-acyl-phospholipid synthase-like methyltransferase
MLADVRMLIQPAASFDRVLMAAALQHFTRAETVNLFRRTAAMLRPGGIFLITDIPDFARLWTFHNTSEREAAHFEQVARGEPILGTWFDRTWLERLGRHAGFSDTTALDQPASHPYARYRFDLRCRR